MVKLNVCWISNIPSPYKTALMNLLGEKCNLTALYEKHREHDREDNWYDRSFLTFTGIYLNRKNFRRIIREKANTCDCLINSDYSNPYAMYAVEQFRRQKKTVFLQADGGLVIPRGPVDYIISKVMKRCDRYISPGKETDNYFAYYGIPKDRISHYRFSCMTQKELECAADCRLKKVHYRESLGIKENHVLLSVGQQIPRKGYDILVQALDGMGLDVGAYIIGGDPEDLVMAYVTEHQLSNVHFIPFMDKKQLSEYYAAADIFVMPTRYDIWGLVINEAMAFGLPVVSTDRCVAAMEFQKQFENVLIVSSENVEELRNAIRKLVQDSKLAEELGKRSQRGIRDYSLEHMRDDLISILTRETVVTKAG